MHLAALACAGAVTASAQDLSALKIGTYQARTCAVPRLFPGQDLCRLCLSPTVTDKPAMCTVVLCRPLGAEALATYQPIVVPPDVGKAARDCPINAICRQESFDFSGWPPKDRPGLPVYRQSEPYKLWLEGARIGHERQLQRGEISLDAYREFLANYRVDWKGLAGR